MTTSTSRTIDTLCHYATDPARRPACQITAVIRRGPIPLCASCDAQRSTLGKAQPATPITPAGPASLLQLRCLELSGQSIH